MWNKRFIIGCLTTFACVASISGAAYGQTWTGGEIMDCNWSSAANWGTPSEVPGTCDEVIITDSGICADVHIDDVSQEPNNLHIGHGMTIFVGEMPRVAGLFVRGMLFITGTVNFAGPAGNGLDARGLRMGEIEGVTGAVLTNNAKYNSFLAGVPSNDSCP